MLKRLTVALAGIAAIAATPLLAQTERLPRRTDIPDDFSTVVCGNETQARVMFAQHYVSDGRYVDSQRLVDGLKLAGCEQTVGPIRIVAVLQRRQLEQGPGGTYMLYRGQRPDGGVVFGIIHEGGNDNHPRTALERWYQDYAPGGVLTATRGESQTYVCPTPLAAQRVVAAIPPMRNRGGANPQQLTAKRAALKAQRCTLAVGQFRVTAVHRSAYVSRGFEAGENWTAVTATNAQGRVVGLLHDTDLL